MNFSKNMFLVTAAVLLCFAGYSNSMSLSDEVKQEKYITSQAFQDLLEKVINESTDANGLAAKATIDAVRKVQAQCKADGANAAAVDEAIEGILSAGKVVAAAAGKINSIIDDTMKLAPTDPKAAVAAIRKGLDSDIELLFAAGVPIDNAQGSALAIAGGAAVGGLRKAIKFIQKGGGEALEALEMAEEIATLGIKAGGDAAQEALKAARAVVESSEITVNVNIFRAAQQACEGLRSAASNKLSQINIEQGIIDSLKSEISTNNPAALTAIEKINSGLNSVLAGQPKKRTLLGAYVMKEGLVSTILETANAIAVAEKALREAGQLALQDDDAAVAAVLKGIKAAKEEVISGSAPAYLGLGAGGKIGGTAAIEGLIPAVIDIEHGRVTSYEDLEFAQKIAINGIRAGGLAATKAVNAAVQICEASGNALYTQFADGAEIGFKVFRNL